VSEVVAYDGRPPQNGDPVDDYPLLHLLWTMLMIFGFIIWFWLLITVFSDLFRRHDCSGGKKVLWFVFVAAGARRSSGSSSCSSRRSSAC